MRALWLLSIAFAAAALAGFAAAHMPAGEAIALLATAYVGVGLVLAAELALARMRGRNEELDAITAALDQIARKEPDA